MLFGILNVLILLTLSPTLTDRVAYSLRNMWSHICPLTLSSWQCIKHNAKVDILNIKCTQFEGKLFLTWGKWLKIQQQKFLSRQVLHIVLTNHCKQPKLKVFLKSNPSWEEYPVVNRSWEKSSLHGCQLRSCRWRGTWAASQRQRKSWKQDNHVGILKSWNPESKTITSESWNPENTF